TAWHYALRHEPITHSRTGARARGVVQPLEELPGFGLMAALLIDPIHPDVVDGNGLGSMGADWDRYHPDVLEFALHRRLQAALPPIGHDDHAGLFQLEVGIVVTGHRRIDS